VAFITRTPSTSAQAVDVRALSESPPRHEPRYGEPPPPTVQPTRRRLRNAHARQPTPRRQLLAGDVLALVAAWLSLASIGTTMAWGYRLLCAAVAVTVTMAVLHRLGMYRACICALATASARTVTAAVIGAGAFLAVESALGPFSLAPALEGGGAAAFALVVARWRFSHWLKQRRSMGQFLRSVVLVGTNDDALSLWTTLNSEPELGYRIAAVVGDRADDRPWHLLPASTTTGDLCALADRVGATGIIVVASALDAESRASVIGAALVQGLHVRFWAGLSGVASRRVRLAPISGLPLFYVEPQRVARWQVIVKRVIDVVLAVVISAATAPVLALAGVLIKLQDGGPVLYRSQRVGRGGATITVLKLRTMVADAAQMTAQVAFLNERTGGPLFKASDDPRVTRLGRWLRGMSLDELPQMWNVLNGTMSLVGPRPALPSEVRQFDAGLSRRHQMRPGITGLWQIEARDNPSFSAYRRLDLAYVDNWSLRLDLAILTSTVHAVLSGAWRTATNVFART
jgi:exopolysaccharide biosynthesis polyprenyl glycosylphosphotransferase